ncbi:MAG TPA: AraC family transcriptional regulator [Vicinamibacterales bacterium]|nr:AraC family transcriptional regulator [Vicinamibacterales bacterium]
MRDYNGVPNSPEWRDLIRPEWLFELVNRAQGFQALVPPGLAPGTQLYQPRSPLERQLFETLQRWQERELSKLGHRVDPTRLTTQIPSHPARRAAPVDVAVGVAETLLREDFSRHWTLERLARRVACNRTDLARSFQHVYGHSPHQYLAISRADQAKLLLATTPWRVEEVANAVGYRSKVSFYRNFRRITGMTPDGYRRRWMLTEPSIRVLALLGRVSGE